MKKKCLRLKSIVLVFVMLFTMFMQLIAVREVSAASVNIYNVNKPGWTPGIAGGIPDVPIVCSVTDFGADGSDEEDDLIYFQSAVNYVSRINNNPIKGAIYVPPGTYVMNGTLGMKSGVVLRGDGADKTHLKFNSTATIINISNGTVGPDIKVINNTGNPSANATKGSTKITLDSTNSNISLINAGSLIEIQKDNDNAMYTRPDWNVSYISRVVGQIVKVIEKNGNVLTLEEPLRENYMTNTAGNAANPKVHTRTPIENTGLEYLHIYRVDTSDTHGINVLGAYNSWIRGCEVNGVKKTSIQVNNSYRIEVRDNYIHDATQFDGGGHGYGLEFINRSSSCLAENNIFKNLRHAMLTQYGANGNVYAYNYSRELGESILPDVSLHGTWAHETLYESNVVERIGVGDWWGPTPYNTFLRNRVNRNIFIEDSSNYTYTIGNEIFGRNLEGSFGSQQPNFKGYNGVNIDYQMVKAGGIDLNTLITHGNYETNAIYWQTGITDHTIPNSYYLSSKPAFFGNKEWPIIGSDVTGKGTIPAEDRWNAGKPNIDGPAVDPSQVPHPQVTKPVKGSMDTIMSMPGLFSKGAFTSAATSMGSHNTGIVTIKMDVTPFKSFTDMAIGFADSSANITDYNMPMIIRMNTDGIFDVRNGGGYNYMIAVDYLSNSTFHLRVEADLAAKTYSVWVTPQGGTETQIAQSYAFRTGTAATLNIDDLGKIILKSPADNEFKITNYSIKSSTFSDTQAPEPPVLNLESKTYKSISFSWSGATDNVASVVYNVYRNNSYLASIQVGTFTDTGLAPSSQYSYIMYARDASGNVSQGSNVLIVTTDSSPVFNSISLTSNKRYIGIGQTAKLTVTGKLLDAYGNLENADLTNADISYSTDKDFVASVAKNADGSATVTGAAYGKVVITANVTLNGITKSSKVDIDISCPDNNVINIAATEDAFGRDGTTYQNTPFGTGNEIEVSNSAAGYRRKSILKFQLNGIPGEVASAKLWVKAAMRDDNNKDKLSENGVYGVTQDGWSQNTVTWSTLPAREPTVQSTRIIPYNSSNNASDWAWYDFDVTEFIGREAAGDKVASLVIEQAGTVGTGFYTKINSSESAYKPYLEITYFKVLDTTDDNLSPTIPTLTSNAKTESSVQLSWTAAQDNFNDDTVTYAVYCNNTYIATTAGLGYIHTGLTASTTYGYYVKAIDAAGNVSDASNTITVITNAAPASGGQSDNDGQAPTGGSQAPSGGTANVHDNKVVIVIEGAKIFLQELMVGNDGAVMAKVDALSIEKAAKALVKEGSIVIEIPELKGATKVSTELPAKTITAAKALGIQGIEIKTGVATVTLHPDAFGASITAESQSVVINLQKVSRDQLPAEVASRISDNLVLNITAYVDNKQVIKSADKSSVKVSFDYKLGQNETAEKVVVYSIDDAGSLKVVKDSRYNTETGKITFTAKNFCKFAVALSKASFNDLDKASWAKTAIEALTARGIIDGVGNGMYAPENKITRAEFIKLLMYTFDLVDESATSNFADVTRGSWYYNSIASAQMLGVVKGYEDGTFGIDKEITREEMVVMVARTVAVTDVELSKNAKTAEFSDMNEIATYAREAVESLRLAGIINGRGDNRFAPKNNATRAEVAKMLYEIYKIVYN